MIDLETMSTLPSATVLTMGAVLFDPQGSTIERTLYVKFNVDEQDRMKRHVDPATIEWWGRQDPKVAEEAFGEDGRIPVTDAMAQLTQFCKGCKGFWSHGATFDLIILNDIYHQLNQRAPWQFWQMRDTRTLFDIGFDHNMNKAGLHNALEDAKRQAKAVQHVYAQLNLLKNPPAPVDS
jgi:hypothetical protein